MASRSPKQDVFLLEYPSVCLRRGGPLEEVHTRYDGLGRQISETYEYPQNGGTPKVITSDFTAGSEKDPSFRRKVVFPGWPDGSHFEFSFTPDHRGYIRKMEVLEPGQGTFQALADYGYEGSWVSTRKVHPGSFPTVDVTWTRDLLGRLTSIQTNQTFQETLDWTAREELKAVKYPHIQSNGNFPGKWDWYKRDGFSRLVKAKYGVPENDYSGGNFDGAGYERYVWWSLDLTDNWDWEKEKRGNDWAVVVDPSIKHDDSDRYPTVLNHPKEGQNIYTYDGNGNLESDGKYAYEYDFLNRLCAVYSVVPQGGSFDTSSWKENGLNLSKRISRATAASKTTVKLDYKSYLALLFKVNARYGHPKFLKTGVPKTLSTVSSSQTTTSEEGVLVSRYAYTPSGLRIMRETYESAKPQDGNRWWCYDGDSMAVAYGQDGETPAQVYGEGVESGEHLALADASTEMNVFFLQDADDSVVSIHKIETDPGTGEKTFKLKEWRQYDYYGVLTRYDDEGTVIPNQNDSDIEWGWAGDEEMYELDPIKIHGSFIDPCLGLPIGVEPDWLLKLVSSILLDQVKPPASKPASRPASRPVPASKPASRPASRPSSKRRRIYIPITRKLGWGDTGLWKRYAGGWYGKFPPPKPSKTQLVCDGEGEDITKGFSLSILFISQFGENYSKRADSLLWKEMKKRFECVKPEECRGVGTCQLSVFHSPWNCWVRPGSLGFQRDKRALVECNSKPVIVSCPCK